MHNKLMSVMRIKKNFEVGKKSDANLSSRRPWQSGALMHEEGCDFEWRHTSSCRSSKKANMFYNLSWPSHKGGRGRHPYARIRFMFKDTDDTTPTWTHLSAQRQRESKWKVGDVLTHVRRVRYWFRNVTLNHFVSSHPFPWSRLFLQVHASGLPSSIPPLPRLMLGWIIGIMPKRDIDYAQEWVFIGSSLSPIKSHHANVCWMSSSLTRRNTTQCPRQSAAMFVYFLPGVSVCVCAWLPSIIHLTPTHPSHKQVPHAFFSLSFTHSLVRSPSRYILTYFFALFLFIRS